MSTTQATRKAPPVRPGDRVFAGLSTGAGILILVILAGVGIFLTAKGVPGILAKPAEVKSGQHFLPWVWPLVYGTLIAASIALLIAVPIAIGVALFISHYAPRRLGQIFGYLIDLLAAVPSVVYGLWGIQFLAPHLVPFYAWLNTHFSFLPFFGTPSATGRTILTACIVLAVMILPIMTAICREIFLQTPRLHEEAALALGATKWEMARLAIFPYARSGIVSAAMLGLGRALGETMAVAMVLSVTAGSVTANLIGSSNPNTIAANIALNFKESTGLSVNALIASGLVLFVITFLVNFAARAVVERRSEFSGAN